MGVIVMVTVVMVLDDLRDNPKNDHRTLEAKFYFGSKKPLQKKLQFASKATRQSQVLISAKKHRQLKTICPSQKLTNIGYQLNE